MAHIALHFIVPLALAIAFYRPGWRQASLVMIGTMLVDADHLLASPVYDPQRCSIGFHPLHMVPAIAVYAVLFAAPLLARVKQGAMPLAGTARLAHLIGLGLLLHMALDAIDCRM